MLAVKNMTSLFKMLLRITRLPKKRLSRFISLCQCPNAPLLSELVCSSLRELFYHRGLIQGNPKLLTFDLLSYVDRDL